MDILLSLLQVHFTMRLINKIKENKHTYHLFPSLLDFAEQSNLIHDLSSFQSDINNMQMLRDKVTLGYDEYLNGNKEIAEKLFTEVMSCDYPLIADEARTNLAYMVRRNETITKYSFEEIVQQIFVPRVFAYMNILLYCVATNDFSSDLYRKASVYMNTLDESDKSLIRKWWGNVDIVGQAESELALSFINEADQ